MSQPVLSVVVPMFDVEPYIAPCLESLAGQRLEDFEVVIVDDGSTDASRKIAEQWVRRDPRLRVVEQPNAGLSAARNTGVRAARGRYLAFCDSDDIVPATAYAALVGSLEATGSDLASGDVRRFNSAGERPHPGYGDAFARDVRRTHIRRHPVLVRDRMVWNKVFRRSFWDANAYEFTLPAFEDAPVMMRAHLEASAVDVLSEIVYLWRIRESGVPSITQRKYEPATFEARMHMVLDTLEVISTYAEELVDTYADDMCRGDIRDALRALNSHDDASLSDALSLARSFVTSVPADIIDALPTTDREMLTQLIKGDMGRLRQLVKASS
ncbi:glycosyltransferase family 2 protein [Actinospica durhamensis]|uniref:Glycosyltransferase family 2 protein n=1 Tax=Actinospica durhamensis TaxID=1508375 RepID=A0A941IR47_9ACTN|nr:glycosyltransferase family 2 protein [Actinospica durhamensis]MBR7834912.1 glycosyltransferase family 2 protein [Actinospica durhamensis]